MEKSKSFLYFSIFIQNPPTHTGPLCLGRLGNLRFKEENFQHLSVLKRQGFIYKWAGFLLTWKLRRTMSQIQGREWSKYTYWTVWEYSRENTETVWVHFQMKAAKKPSEGLLKHEGWSSVPIQSSRIEMKSWRLLKFSGVVSVLRAVSVRKKCFFLPPTSTFSIL